MSKITLATAVRVHGWARTALTKIHDRGDRGQTAFEYLGIILVVVAIIGGMVASGIGSAITARITGLVNSITAG
ncbi:hypothetical protein NX801_02315 [Streptomyces sp. LP05-1]|uniref:Flp family type IVb pilin n=1 Tax=Streptomyces pyxinae TaxID=2970734 RepID=A0ABT2CCN6_9ACTN|nr:hypothetical protein [Streptomyces sp. LP05-1]MCS0634516.1 hypothetical protein [Streptomyces sp. LP05-1]